MLTTGKAALWHDFDFRIIYDTDADVEGVLVQVVPVDVLYTEDLSTYVASRYFDFELENGGSAGLITSFILCWVGFLAVMTPLAELASMALTSSGQYHWVYMLAPPKIRNLLSYLTGMWPKVSPRVNLSSF